MTIGVADLFSRQEVLANRAFVFALGMAGTASNYSLLELWNPANSGVNVYITDTIPYPMLSVTTAHNAIVMLTTTQYAGSSSFGVSKLSGGAASKAQIISFNVTPFPSGARLQSYAFTSPTGYQPQQVVLKHPYILKPGNGLIIVQDIVNLNFGCNFMWVEQ